MLGDDGGSRLSLLCFLDGEFTGVLIQLRQDFGESEKGSDRVRPAQQEPTGWGSSGSTSQDAEVDSHRRRRRAQSENTDAEDAASVLESEPSEDIDN